MPLYEYSCPSCNTVVEIIQKFNEPAPLCKLCLSGNPHDENVMVRQMSRGSFRLKGTGWYRDGYSKKGKKK